MQIDIEGPAGFRRAVAVIQKRKLKVSFLPVTALTEIPQFCSSRFLTLGRSAA
ncbi:hypothetical protein [Microbacterium sp. PAMC22086]|uniref:hypothetical protein n=1 Tax=Microbacterium sp. PAMC22086 TaxID=2861281 RepID=UPI001C62A751|nr:hypothetical protein [Microbacterium sp. PAMC22086]QYG11377.1 hypothetical protein KY497_14095 [Microbacterium sp. PAMC22086]